MAFLVVSHLEFSFTAAEALLNSELLPRKIELEQRYLEEALELLTSSQVRVRLNENRSHQLASPSPTTKHLFSSSLRVTCKSWMRFLTDPLHMLLI